MKRAQIRLELEEFEEAVRDYEAASELDPSNRGSSSCVHQAYVLSDIRRQLQDAQLELKKSKRKNYYKILGVEKVVPISGSCSDILQDATERDIKRAYKKMAMKFHPGVSLSSVVTTNTACVSRSCTRR